jgi:cation diffusion facilitator CzcD-associated flavoprotein CzcO
MIAPLDWLIVGGGVHGTYLSHVLVSRAGVARDRVRVLDPQEHPLETFWRVTGATGMRYLRSPGVHHVDLHPYALRRFAQKGVGKRLARFGYPYDRPGLEFFRAHTEHVVREHGLGSLRQRCRATTITRLGQGYRVETDQGALDSRRVVLALGLGEQLCVPSWARPLGIDARIQHIFAATFRREAATGARSVAIVGGGISAAQLACALVAAGTEVTVVARHAPRIHRFDSDPEWLGPKAMSGFSRTRDPRERRRLIATARHRGSMPPEIARDLRRELRCARAKWLEAEPVSADVTPAAVRLRLDRAPHLLEVDRVVLATGFEAHRPGGALLGQDAIDRLGLPCADCGYPLVSPRLEWASGLFVTGPLAELELGPTARNIAGARAAGERLLAVA